MQNLICFLFTNFSLYFVYLIYRLFCYYYNFLFFFFVSLKSELQINFHSNFFLCFFFKKHSKHGRDMKTRPFIRKLQKHLNFTKYRIFFVGRLVGSPRKVIFFISVVPFFASSPITLSGCSTTERFANFLLTG